MLFSTIVDPKNLFSPKPNAYISLKKFTTYATCMFYIYRRMFKTLIGGALLLQCDEFERVNGFSNQFYKWGGEDDDMFNRYHMVNCCQLLAIIVKYGYPIRG